MTEEIIYNVIKKGVYDEIIETPSIKRDYHTRGSWTPIIKKIVEKAILGMECDEWPMEMCVFNSHYTVDSLLTEYKYKDSNGKLYHTAGFNVDGTEIWLYPRKLHIAVEYENDNLIWPDEVDKLSHLRCDYKVIISYSQSKGKTLNYEGVIEEKLKLVCDSITENEPTTSNDKWLIIFLPISTLDIQRMVGYKMKNGQFVKIS